MKQVVAASREKYMWLAAWLGIQVIFALPQQCSSLNYIGCYYPGDNKIYVTDKPTRKPKEYVVYHELGHLCGYKAESNADEYADYWYSGKLKHPKTSRKMEFILITKICKDRIAKGDMPNKEE